MQPEYERPELSKEIHVSNLVFRMDGKIKEVIDFLKMYENDDLIPNQVIKTAIKKLDLI